MTELTQRFAVVVIFITLLSACGADSGSTPQSTAIVSPVTVPSPTAPPTTQPPSSQYAPAPAPAPVLPFTFDQSFDVTAIAGFSVRRINYGDSSATQNSVFNEMQPFASSTMPRFIWSQTAQRMRQEFNVSVTEYAAPQIEQILTNRAFIDQSSNLKLGWVSTTRYVKIANWSRMLGPISWAGKPGQASAIFGALVGNKSTVPWDTSRTLRYEGTTLNAPLNFITPQPISFSVWPGLPGDNNVSANLQVTTFYSGGKSVAGILLLKGTFDILTNRFEGKITDFYGNFSGTFEGALFGPNHDEFGLIYQFSETASEGEIYGGVAIGTRYFL